MDELLPSASSNASSSASSTNSSRMRHMFSSRESTKDVVVQYQNSMQQLVDALHQVQRDVKCLKDLQHVESSYRIEANEGIQQTMRELHEAFKQSKTPAALGLDLQQGFEEVLDSLQVIAEKQAQLLQKAQAHEKRLRRRRPIGLIEGVFRGLDLLLMKGFTHVANRQCAAPF